MRFKSEHMREQFEQTDEVLKALAADFVVLSQMLKIQPVVTRVSDTVEGESGVHQAMRAVDFRDEHAGKFLYDHDEREAILKFLNLKYERTDGYKAVIWHNFRGGAHHWHLQVPYDKSNLKRRLV